MTCKTAFSVYVPGNYFVKIFFVMNVMISMALFIYQLYSFYRNLHYTEISTESYEGVGFPIGIRLRAVQNIPGMSFACPSPAQTVNIKTGLGSTRSYNYDGTSCLTVSEMLICICNCWTGGSLYLALVKGTSVDDASSSIPVSLNCISTQEMIITPQSDIDIEGSFTLQLLINTGLDIGQAAVSGTSQILHGTVRVEIESTMDGNSLIDSFFIPFGYSFGSALAVAISPHELRTNGETDKKSMTTVLQGVSEFQKANLALSDDSNNLRVSCSPSSVNCVQMIVFQAKKDYLIDIIDHKTRTVGELIAFVGAAWSASMLVLMIFFRHIAMSGKSVFELRTAKEIVAGVAGATADKAKEKVMDSHL